MSGERFDELAESARNRGLKLVRSRVRTPTKRGFNKVGLTDKSGKAVFGMDAKGPTAITDEVEHYLRNLGAKDWGASLDVAVTARTRKPAAKPAPRPPQPKAKPKPSLRDAKPSDAQRLVELMKLLGHGIDEKSVRRNLAALKKAGEPPLVAVEGAKVVGLIGIHIMATIHRRAPVGRIPILVVAPETRGKGIGRMLVDAAEAFLRKAGCTMVEVTSNDRLAEAHAFYRHVGYERTSIRFMKTL